MMYGETLASLLTHCFHKIKENYLTIEQVSKASKCKGYILSIFYVNKNMHNNSRCLFSVEPLIY